MKSPHTFPNRSLSRRLLSTFLSLAMVLSLLPVWTLPAMADGGAVIYDRKTPEVSILNAYSGRSEKLYSAIKGDGASAYNGIGLYKRQSTGAQAKYSDRATGNNEGKAWDFDLGKTAPVLKELVQVSENLQLNTSATFYNRTHSHSHYSWKEVKTYTAEMTVTEKVTSTFSGSTRVIDGWSDKSRTYPRIGDLGGVQSNNSDGFNTIYYKKDNDYCSLQFSHRTFAWKDFEYRTCTCGGSYAENFVVAFRDERAPVCTGASYSVDGGSWVKSTKGVRVGAGQSVRIKLSFNEPIRFADDSANHGDLKLILQPDGTSADTSPAAGLAELSGNDLIFQYTVPQGQNLEINTLNTSRLFGENLPLKQVGPNGSFSIAGDIKVNGSTLGLSTTTSYITDLAGNAIVRKDLSSANLTLDTTVPYVEKVTFDLALNNADVKEALGKDKWDVNSEQYQRDYTDASDLYLGAGDSLSLTLHMNERVKGIAMTDIEQGRVIHWRHALATTNLKDAGGNYVTLRSQFFLPYDNRNSGNTCFVMQPITIGEDWTVDGHDGKIVVTKLELSKDTTSSYGSLDDTVTDLAGNALNKSHVTIAPTANANPPLLDTVAPTAEEIADSYAQEDNGFRYGVTLSDNASGYAGIYGSFTLNNGGDGKAYQYEWAVTAKADTVPSKWSVGVTGVAQQFKQTDPIYFHIRPLSGEHYGDLSGCTVTVNARDYAGNTGAATLPPDGKLEWYIDNLAPTVKFGGTGRKLDSGGTSGTLTAQIVLSDSQGISGWQFAWSDSDTNAPEADTWENGAVSATSNATPVNVSTSVTVNKGELFSKYLWVKATDNSTGQNTSEPICLGRCSYDLRSAQYQLSNISGIMKTASLEIQSLSDTDALFFLIQAEDDSDYALLRAYGGESNAGRVKGNIFGNENPWDGICVTYEKNTNTENTWTYSLRNADSSDAKATLSKLRDGTFSGELTVTILSGKSETVNSQQEGYAWVLGNGTYSFSADTLKLRVAGENVDNYEAIAIRCEDDLNRLLPTPAGLRFTVSIDKDKNGWGYEDINWQESYVRLVNMLQGQNAEYLLPLGPFQVNADGSTTQTVTVPAGDYPTGRYRAELHMKCTAGKDYLAVLGTDLGNYTPVYVDATRPSDDFTLASVTYNPTASRTGSNPYGLADSENYGTRQWTAEGGVYTLPVSFGYNFASFNYAESAHDVRNLYTIRVTAEKETETTFLDTGYTAGSFSVQLWNTARPDNRISLDATDGAKQTEFTNAVDNYKVGFAFSENDLWKNQELYLAPGVVNTVAVQKVYANGLTSSVKYVQIKPVDDHINGTTTIDAQTRELVFTPEIGANTAGASVYAWAWQNENMNTRSINDETPDDKHYLNGGGVRIDLTAQADGTWRAPLLAGGACYQVITESATGSLRELPTQVYQRAPWFDNCFVYADDQDYFRYQNDIEIKDNKDGTYTMQFAVRDDGETLKDGLDIDLAMTFKTADSENTHSLNIHYADAAAAIRTSSGNSSEVPKDFTGALQEWLPDGAEASGVLCVKLTPYEPFSYGNNPRNAAYKRDVLNVEILAAYPEGYDTMDVSATATDAMGNAGSKTAAGVDIQNKYVAPKPKADASGMVGSLDASADFAVEFNRPVYPADSWAWRAADNEDQPYATKWAQAFPVPGNGAWEIQYLDIFGKLITKTITTDAFTDAEGKDWSIKLNISATEPTADPVILRLSSGIGYIGVHDSNVHWIYEDGKYLIQDRQVTIDENGRYTAACYEYDETNSEQRAKSSIKIYIDNIVNGAPTAQVHYYVQALGQEFTQSELDAYAASGVTVTGNVRAWYTTARHVTPTDGTGSDFLFTPDSAASHTFTYADDFGNTGSVTAALPAGLTLKAPPQPPKDTTPPDVDVDIYVKRSGSYTRAGAFLATDSKAVIDDKFDALGYVQGYSLTVKATDESGIERITVAGDGAAITGNVITITAPGTFTVTVTDKAVDPATGKSAPNQTLFTFTVPDKIDNTPPTVTVTPVSTSLYSKNLYVRVADTSGAAALMSPAGLDIVPDTTTDNYDKQHIGAYKYVAADNKTVQFTAIDEAGNTGSTSATISGIDTEPPELTVRWSPSRRVQDAETGKYTYIDKYPTDQTVNTNITAHILSNKAMYDLSVTVAGKDIQLLAAGKATADNPHVIKHAQDGTTIATITAVPERVTVTYEQGYGELKFTASSANGKSTAVTLNGVTVIDKVAPEVNQMIKRYDRAGKEVGSTDAAYQAVVALYPSESVTSANYGGWTNYELPNGTVERRPDRYGPSEKMTYLSLTFTANGTYNVRFADQAGNTAVVPVTITGIDRTAPELTVTTVEESNQVKATITANENCKVTADGTDYTMTANTSQTVTFSKNGTFAITATDAAGNESFKTVRVGSIDNDPPSISFDNGTIYVTEGTAADALKEELDKGYTVWDNVTAKNDLTVTYDSSAVNLTAAGQYAVTYTVTDKAGNKTTANRFVRVIGANTVCVSIDGKLILPDSTAVLRPGAHTLTLQNSDQPYSIKARRGILSAGQMKYLSGSSLHFDADGKFTVSSTGYYTLLVTTQDRQTIRVLLYVEQ
ncbi:immunoglobulin-like domain-containing protein [Oscillibacter sp. MSJ-31]|uniref:immunoglobulin-like domain-containing protein n=1 Tax=Oscillibacter sp. MSJ-31 TaxID=2841526 RepID=UPI001C121EBD|nr:immunoglobulin-like domain-containing protein [Oscillibacter sp. MSJ-31]MBU5457603.1 DUF5011 domain-containing protein [Oscillibacter sp. MSJ-31]